MRGMALEQLFNFQRLDQQYHETEQLILHSGELHHLPFRLRAIAAY